MTIQTTLALLTTTIFLLSLSNLWLWFKVTHLEKVFQAFLHLLDEIVKDMREVES